MAVIHMCIGLRDRIAAARERLRWATSVRRHPVSLAARLRLWWADFVIHVLFEDGERCGDCGRGYPAWGAPDDLWLLIKGNRFGTLCPACFVRRCRGIGLAVRFQAQVAG